MTKIISVLVLCSLGLVFASCQSAQPPDLAGSGASGQFLCGFNTNENDCEDAFGCTWDTWDVPWASCKSSFSCEGYSYLKCAGEIGCFWDEEECFSSSFPPCEKLTKGGCDRFPVCLWQASNSTCLDRQTSSCTQFNKGDTCLEAGYRCRWNDASSACQATKDLPCANLERSFCDYKKGKCTWNSDQCIEACSALPANSCLERQDCQVKSGQCTAKCGSLTKDSCQSRSDCSWTSDRCIESCSALSTRAPCLQRTDCQWVDDSWIWSPYCTAK